MNKQKLAYIISSAAFLGSASLFPAFADQITVSGNGAFSDNHVRISERSEKHVSQSNNTSISNHVSSHSNTGHNSASYNTGGSSSIHAGNARSDVSIHNVAGVNVANNNWHEGKHSGDTWYKHNDNDCHYYLTFLYQHKGYDGDWSCEEAYEFFMDHKDDHFNDDHLYSNAKGSHYGSY